MANRIELQNKGAGYHKDPLTGKAQGPGTSHKSMARTIRINKRIEAEERNKRTHPEAKRSYWRERGFSRGSHAMRTVARTVAEGNEIANRIREKSGIPDWEPLNV